MNSKLGDGGGKSMRGGGIEGLWGSIKVNVWGGF